MFIEIGKEVPSYAGHFIAGDGRLTAYVADSADLPAARLALQKRVLSGRLKLPRGANAAALVVLKGKYSFQELSNWRDDTYEQVLGKIPGVYTDDMDEAHNSVTIGVDPSLAATAEQAVLAKLTSLGAVSVKIDVA